MKYPFKMIFHDSKRALQLRHEVQIGHYFVFVKDNKPSSVAHKEKRLLVKGDDKVLPLHCFCFWYERSCYPFK